MWCMFVRSDGGADADGVIYRRQLGMTDRLNYFGEY